MNPTLSGGGEWVIKACNHSIAFGSRHIGSLPGVLGSSGTQVHTPAPLRSTVMLPSSRISAMVASRDTARGAALIALAIFAASVFGALCSAAWAISPSIETSKLDRRNARVGDAKVLIAMVRRFMMFLRSASRDFTRHRRVALAACKP